MRYVSWVSSEAHVAVMRDAKPGMMEYQLEARFLFHIADAGGCRHCAYTCICVAHPGTTATPARPTTCGCSRPTSGSRQHEYRYASTSCSYPIGGSFTADQRLIFGAVLDAQVAVIGAMRPAHWVEMHTLAWRAVLSALRGGGVVKGDVDEDAAGLGAVHAARPRPPDRAGHARRRRLPVEGPAAAGGARVEAAHRARARRRPGAHRRAGLLLYRRAVGPARRRRPGASSTKGSSSASAASAAAGRGRRRRHRRRVDNYTLCPRTVEEIEGVMAGVAAEGRRRARPAAGGRRLRRARWWRLSYRGQISGTSRGLETVWAGPENRAGRVARCRRSMQRRPVLAYSRDDGVLRSCSPLVRRIP